MEYASFRVLHKMLQPRLRHNSGAKAARNGFIDSTIRLSCALRYFAGGSAYDIALVHGVSHSEVFNSIWRVVDAVMECNDLAFSFPVDHDAQQQLALEFKKKSAASFPNCVGAVDGMLLWRRRGRTATHGRRQHHRRRHAFLFFGLEILIG